MRKKITKTSIVKHVSRKSPSHPDFGHVLALIENARTHAITAVNTTLIDLYWLIGQYITRKIDDQKWGQGTVQDLAAYIQKHHPNLRGYSAQNLWRMRQFYDTYRCLPKLSTLLRELPWSHNLEIMSRSKTRRRTGILSPRRQP